MSNGGSQNGDFLGVVQRNMAALTDDELLKVVTVEAQDYRPEAIDIAWAELRRRGIDAPSPQEIQKIQQQSAEDRQNAPLRQLRWLKFYIFVIAVDSAGALYSFIGDPRRADAGWLTVRACQLALFCFLLPGLIRRTRWAYYLNWVYIALTTYAFTVRWSPSWWGLPVFVSIWALPNFVYFGRRRRLFLGR